MTHAHDFIQQCNALAAELARGPVRAGTTVGGVVVRRVRVWPTPESVDWMGEVGPVMGPANGWLDSSLDLRDGLSVVEVYAEDIVADSAFGELVH